MIPKFRKRGRPPEDNRRHIQIAATVDWRGTEDNQLFFLFRNVPCAVLQQTFRQLIGNGNGIASDARIFEEHDLIRRNGKGYWRWAVEIIEPNDHFCTIDDMKVLIEAFFHRLHPCTVRWFDIETFLNI